MGLCWSEINFYETPKNMTQRLFSRVNSSLFLLSFFLRLTIPSCSKFDHRCGLDNVPLDCRLVPRDILSLFRCRSCLQNPTGTSPMTFIRNDEELNKLLAGVTIAQGGVLPNIQAVLLPKKSEKAAKA